MPIEAQIASTQNEIQEAIASLASDRRSVRLNHLGKLYGRLDALEIMERIEGKEPRAQAAAAYIGDCAEEFTHATGADIFTIAAKIATLKTFL